MVSAIEQSFKLNLRIMKALFLYHPSQCTRSYMVQVYIKYLLLTIPISVLGVLYLLLEDNPDKDRLRDDAFVVSEMIFYFPKVLPFIVNSAEINKAIHYMELPIFTGFNAKQTKIIAGSVRICRRNTRIYLFCIVVGGFGVWASKPFLEDSRRLPIDLWLPVDEAAHPIVFWVVFLLTLMEILYPGLCTAVIDPLIGGLACLATGQLKVLKDNLQHLSEYVDEEMSSNNKQPDLKSKIMYEKIKKCIDHHNAILEFVKVYERSFSFVVFSLFMGSIIRICICCLQLSMLSFNFLSVLSYINIMLILLIQLYFYCYYGTELYEESNSLTNAIYSGNWYEYDIKSRKALITIMERGKIPMVVTSGQVLNLSLDTFTMVLRRSYSLLAVLKSY